MNESTQQKTLHALVCGVANERSIAWAITQALLQQSYHVHLTWLADPQLRRIERLREKLPADQAQRVHLAGACDLSKDHDVNRLVTYSREELPQLDALVHAVAYGQLRDEQGEPRPLGTISFDEFSQCLHISAHSFSRLLAVLADHGSEQAAALCLSYMGAERVTPGYDLMAVAKSALETSVRYLAVSQAPHWRVNAIRAGSIRTAASSASPGFAERHAAAAERAPLGRSISAHEVASAASFLLSPAAAAITGQVVTVDGGWSLLAPQ